MFFPPWLLEAWNGNLDRLHSMGGGGSLRKTYLVQIAHMAFIIHRHKLELHLTLYWVGSSVIKENSSPISVCNGTVNGTLALPRVGGSKYSIVELTLVMLHRFLQFSAAAMEIAWLWFITLEQMLQILSKSGSGLLHIFYNFTYLLMKWAHLVVEGSHLRDGRGKTLIPSLIRRNHQTGNSI